MSGWEDHGRRVTTAVEIAKLLITLNGGAAIAVLTFWGHSADAIDPLTASKAIKNFAVGMGIATLAALLVYTGQATLDSFQSIFRRVPIAQTFSTRAQPIVLLLSSVFAIGGMIGFLAGVYQTSNALERARTEQVVPASGPTINPQEVTPSLPSPMDL